MRLAKLSSFMLAMAALSLSPGFCLAQAKPPDEDAEVKLGRDNAIENDKQVKLINDATLLARVNKIGQELGTIANSVEVPAHWGTAAIKKFQYSFKIVDDKDVNAYSLPGGFIYVHKGLLDYVHSDDELAGVLAHEVAHAAHHHMMKLIREQNKLQPWVLLPVLLAGVKGNGDSAAKVALAGQLFMTAKLNSLGIEAEKDADQTGVRYLLKTKYNPSGLVTFMERLAHDEQNRPMVTLGIYQTHPPSPERAKAAIEQLTSLGVEINRREVDPQMRAESTNANLNGVDVVEVRMYKIVVTKLRGVGGVSAADRAKKFGDTLNKLLDQGLQGYEVRVSSDSTRIIARNTTLLVFDPSDAELQKVTMPQLAQSTVEAVRKLIWQENFNKPSGGGL